MHARGPCEGLQLYHAHDINILSCLRMPAFRAAVNRQPDGHAILEDSL